MKRLLSFFLFLSACCIGLPRAEGAVFQKDNPAHAVVSSGCPSPQLTSSTSFPFPCEGQQSDILIAAKDLIASVADLAAAYTADYLITDLKLTQPELFASDFYPARGQLSFLRILFRQIIAPNAP